MPFNRDTRTCWCNVEFNEAFIWGCLTDMELRSGDVTIVMNDNFTEYVRQLEDDFTIALSKDRKINFDNWFIDNYNNVYAYDKLNNE